MKKRNIRITVICVLLTLTLAFSAVLLAACDNEAEFRADYARAEANWNAATNKEVTDSLVVEGTLGDTEEAIPVRISLEGKRVYIGDEFEMTYNLGIVGLDALNPLLGILGNGFSLTLHRGTDGLIECALSVAGLIDLPFSFAESVIYDYVPVFDFSWATFYDTENIAGTADAYTVAGADSLAYVLWQIAPILSNNFGFDMLDYLESWLMLGDVTGAITFDGANFATMTTSQEISLVLPWSDADFLAHNIDNFPEIILDVIETKKLDITLEGFALSLDFSSIFRDGIRLDATVSSDARYNILSDDATFESVEND